MSKFEKEETHFFYVVIVKNKELFLSEQTRIFSNYEKMMNWIKSYVLNWYPDSMIANGRSVFFQSSYFPPEYDAFKTNGEHLKTTVETMFKVLSKEDIIINDWYTYLSCKVGESHPLVFHVTKAPLVDDLPKNNKPLDRLVGEKRPRLK